MVVVCVAVLVDLARPLLLLSVRSAVLPWREIAPMHWPTRANSVSLCREEATSWVGSYGASRWHGYPETLGHWPQPRGRQVPPSLLGAKASHRRSQ